MAAVHSDSGEAQDAHVLPRAEDPNVRRDHLEAWALETTASFSVHVFPGGHFYLHQQPAQFRAALCEDLDRAL